MYRRIRVKPLGIAVLSVIGILIVFNIVLFTSPRDKNEGLRYYINNKIGSGCISYRQDIFSRKLRDKLPDYIGNQALRESGNAAIKRSY